MPRFRKKPVEVEAMQFTEESKDRVWSWVRAHGGRVDPSRDESGLPVLVIYTLNGPVRAGIGEWVVRGVKGEWYPCAADIFEATYEAVVEAASR